MRDREREPCWTYRLEIRGRLPGGAGEELRRRFGEVAVRSLDARTVISDLRVDQAALRAVLGLLWDVGCEVRLVQAVPPTGQDEGGDAS